MLFGKMYLLDVVSFEINTHLYSFYLNSVNSMLRIKTEYYFKKLVPINKLSLVIEDN